MSWHKMLLKLHLIEESMSTTVNNSEILFSLGHPTWSLFCHWGTRPLHLAGRILVDRYLEFSLFAYYHQQKPYVGRLQLGVEGFLLYRAVVTVFDTGETKRLNLYLFGYGIPLVIG